MECVVVYLSPVHDELLLEGYAHGLVLLPPVPVGDHQLHVHLPPLQGVLPILHRTVYYLFI